MIEIPKRLKKRTHKLRLHGIGSLPCRLFHLHHNPCHTLITLALCFIVGVLVFLIKLLLEGRVHGYSLDHQSPEQCPACKSIPMPSAFVQNFVNYLTLFRSFSWAPFRCFAWNLSSFCQVNCGIWLRSSKPERGRNMKRNRKLNIKSSHFLFFIKFIGLTLVNNII